MKEAGEDGVAMLEENKPMKLSDNKINNEVWPQNVIIKFSISRALWPQILLIIAGILFSTSYGMSAGHSAVLLPQLNSTNSSIKFDENIASWIASSHSIAGPFGCLLGGIFVNIWGRKRILVVADLGMIIGWVMIAAAQNHTVLIAARIIEGFSKGIGATALTVLCDETADPKLRGSIFSIGIIAISIGVFAISGLGSVVDWRTASGIAAAITVAVLITLVILPESPTWLVQKDRVPEARHVLNRLWGTGKELQAEDELQNLIERLRPNENVQEDGNRMGHRLYIRGITHFLRILFSSHVLKPFIIIHIFNTFQAICGHEFFVYYSIDIFTRINKMYSSESLDVYLANIVISIVRIVVGIFSTICMFRINRRTIGLISGFGSSLSAISIAIILFVKSSSNSDLIPAHSQVLINFALIIIFIGSYIFGFYTLPNIMIGETHPTLVRGFVCGYIFTATDIFTGIVIKTYYSMLKTIEIQGMFLLFGIWCLIMTIFLYIFLPETQGKTLLEIEDYFKQTNIMWITRKRNISKKITSNVDNPLLNHTQ